MPWDRKRINNENNNAIKNIQQGWQRKSPYNYVLRCLETLVC